MRTVLRLLIAFSLMFGGAAAHADPALTEIFHCDYYMCY